MKVGYMGQRPGDSISDLDRYQSPNTVRYFTAVQYEP